MAALITLAELEAQFLAARVAECTTDAAVIAAHILDQSGIAEGYVQDAGYAIPLAAAYVTPALKRRVAALVMQSLAGLHPEWRGDDGAMPYDKPAAEARAWLERVAAGFPRLEGVVAIAPFADAPATPWTDAAAGVDRDGEDVVSGF